MQEHILDADNAPVARKRDFGIVDLSALLRRGEEMFDAVFDPFDRTIELHRRPRQHHFLGIEQHDLRTEAAADARRDHAHLPFAETEHLRKPVA